MQNKCYGLANFVSFYDYGPLIPFFNTKPRIKNKNLTVDICYHLYLLGPDRASIKYFIRCQFSNIKIIKEISCVVITQ